MSECQKQFEAWWSVTYFRPVERDSEGYYYYSRAQISWLAWQAAWNARTGAGL